ncbi:MAG TPA: MFS transporter [Thermomicrobiales bacterium]|nr:MFS transporter [Thermomicrobiales bacterium]
MQQSLQKARGGKGIEPFWFAVKLNIYGFGLMALWNTVNTVLLPQRVQATAPAALEGSALGLVSLVGIGLAAVIQPIAGRVSDRASLPDRRKPFIIIGTALAIPLLLIVGWAPIFAGLLVAYVLLQIATNVAQAAFQALIPDIVPEEGRGLSSGVKNTLSVLGAAVGLIGARVLAGVGAPAILEFVYLGFLLGFTAYLTNRWVPRVKPLPKDEQASSWIELFDVGGLWRSFTKTLRDHPLFRRAVIAQFFFLLGTYPAQRFLLYFLRDRLGGGAEQGASVGLVAAIAVAALAAVAGGGLSDQVGRRPMLVGCVILAAAGMAGLAVSPTLLPIAISGGMVAMGVGAFQAVNWALLSDDMPAGHAARAYGVANVATAGSSALAGLFGPLVDLLNSVLPGSAYTITFSLAALIILVSLIPLYRTDEYR